MFELEINGVNVPFKFGILFMREMNKRHKRTENGITKEIGLQLAIGGLIDNDIEDLIAVLDTANKTETPRISKADIERHIEDENTDIDEMFKTVLDFLSKANVTKTLTNQILKMWEDEQAKQQN